MIGVACRTSSRCGTPKGRRARPDTRGCPAWDPSGRQPAGLRRAVERHPVQVTRLGVVGRGEVVDLPGLAVDADDVDHVECAGRDQPGLAPVARGDVQVTPAVALAGPGESSTAVDPVEVIHNVDPRLVPLGQGRADLARLRVREHHLVGVLEPVQVLEDQLTRADRPSPSGRGSGPEGRPGRPSTGSRPPDGTTPTRLDGLTWPTFG